MERCPGEKTVMTTHGEESSPKAKIIAPDIDVDAFKYFSRTLQTLLSSDVAKYAFAQIADGLPTSRVFDDYSMEYRDDIEDRLDPSEASMILVEEFCLEFRPETLRIDAQVAQAYQDAQPDSREFNMRLLELVATVIHELAIDLYQALHPNGARQLATVMNTTGNIGEGIMMPDLRHPHYLNMSKYPHGAMEVVGYWAEAQILGGVILFDRGGSGRECKRAFIHPGRFATSIIQLSPTQVELFATLGREENATENLHQVCPFSPEDDAERYSDNNNFALNIYRDAYERNPRIVETLRCVRPAEPDLIKACQELVARNEAERNRSKDS
ncbi:MAG: hypothetical protein M4579_002279 [Chaenotheca gracillima]|nr:MAG: hypothetical protein M4579_002279 [Chaenotheca gracillima]